MTGSLAPEQRLTQTEKVHAFFCFLCIEQPDLTRNAQVTHLVLKHRGGVTCQCLAGSDEIRAHCSLLYRLRLKVLEGSRPPMLDAPPCRATMSSHKRKHGCPDLGLNSLAGLAEESQPELFYLPADMASQKCYMAWPAQCL